MTKKEFVTWKEGATRDDNDKHITSMKKKIHEKKKPVTREKQKRRLKKNGNSYKRREKNNIDKDWRR